MPTSIALQIAELRLTGTLNDTDTARAIADALPIEATVNRWGSEIYFSIPVQCPQADDARDVMGIGELAYWPPGSAFCIFWGPTPASTADEPRAAGPVNPIGRIDWDDQLAAKLDAAQTGRPILIIRLDA